MKKRDVIIVGAGPVGLTLAIALGRSGVDVSVVERNAQPLFLPKMERCNPRTMEFFRRLGIAEKVRSKSRFTDVPMDVFVGASFRQDPLLHLHYESVVEARKKIATCQDGSWPLEPSQLISQYTLEPLLRSIAEECSMVRFNCELLDFVQQEDAVVARVRNERGETEEISAFYLVGCDGGSSTVRKQLGIKLGGEGDLARMRMIFFQSEELYDQIPFGKGRHYYFPKATLVVQDDLRHFIISSSQLEKSAADLVRETLTIPVQFEVLADNPWRHTLLISDKYQSDRVFLAGDSAHLVIPTGGLGMNTGVGDAMDLAWKLAGTLAGWGGEQLLRAYDIERRQVGLRNLRASGYAARGVRSWRNSCRDWICEDSAEEGRANRAEVARLANEGQRRSHEMSGIELGYRYINSPLICTEQGEGPDAESTNYIPSTFPGARLPHVWVEQGVSIHDCAGSGYTLIDVSEHTLSVDAFVNAFERLSAPLKVLRFAEERLRLVFGANLLLVRPDLHVAWRSNTPPMDASAVARHVTGNAELN